VYVARRVCVTETNVWRATGRQMSFACVAAAIDARSLTSTGIKAVGHRLQILKPILAGQSKRCVVDWRRWRARRSLPFKPKSALIVCFVTRARSVVNTAPKSQRRQDPRAIGAHVRAPKLAVSRRQLWCRVWRDGVRGGLMWRARALRRNRRWS
jgi:hypothetical protein